MAEDLAQEALARLGERWATPRRPDHPMAWSYRVGVNLARSAARRRGIEKAVLRRVALDTTGAGAAEGLPQELVVRSAVVRLPARQRQAVVARHYLGLSVKQTASVMGCAQGTVTALTHQAVTSLRRSLFVVDPETYEEVEHGSS